MFPAVIDEPTSCPLTSMKRKGSSEISRRGLDICPIWHIEPFFAGTICTGKRHDVDSNCSGAKSFRSKKLPVLS